MWVVPAARGLGGGRLLCDACAAWAREHGYSEIVLDVVVANERAVRAYQAAGFVIRDEHTWSGHGRALHEYAMARTL